MSKQLGDINRSLARAHRTLEHENDALTGKAWAAQLELKALAKQVGEDIEVTNPILDEIDQLASSLKEKVYKRI